jgi:hypothetical protein
MVEKADTRATAPETTPPATPDPALRLTMIPGGIPDLDALVVYLASQAAGEPLKMRLPFMVMDPGTGDYTTWTNVRWGLEMTAEDAIELRKDLDSYLQAWVASRRTKLAAQPR